MDLNADGHPDLLSGSYSRKGRPMAGLFQVLWGRPDGTFKKATVLNGVDDKPLIIPSSGDDREMESICTRPTAVDWDADGDLDLVIGSMEGRFYLFRGEGRGRFAAKSDLIKAGDEQLRVQFHGDPFVVDWDGDGDLDLLSGAGQGGVHWARNTGGPKKPIVLEAFQALIAAPEEPHRECRPNEVTAPAGSTRVWAADLNGDGKLDILVGDRISLVSPAKGVSEAEYTKRRQSWEKEYEAADRIELPDNAADDAAVEAAEEALSKRLRALYKERKEFMEEDHTGFVWVYLHK